MKLFNQLSIFKDCILFNDTIVVPKFLQPLALSQFPEGHPGICAMKAQARSLIWFPEMDQAIVDLVNCWSAC